MNKFPLFFDDNLLYSLKQINEETFLLICRASYKPEIKLIYLEYHRNPLHDNNYNEISEKEFNQYLYETISLLDPFMESEDSDYSFKPVSNFVNIPDDNQDSNIESVLESYETIIKNYDENRYSYTKDWKHKEIIPKPEGRFIKFLKRVLWLERVEWKFPLQNQDQQVIRVPKDHKLIRIDQDKQNYILIMDVNPRTNLVTLLVTIDEKASPKIVYTVCKN